MTMWWQSAPAQPDGPQLRDIHLPPSPSWWPPAPGWWMVAVLLLAATGLLAWWWRRRRRERLRVAAIVAEVDTLMAMYGTQPTALAGHLHQLLRRAARTFDPNATQLRGQAWRDCLASVPVPTQVIDRLCALDDAMFRRSSDIDGSLAAEAVRTWLLAALRGRRRRAARVPDVAQRESERA